MSDKEFFRAEYRKAKDSDGEEWVVPTVWIGNQGFDLTPQYEQGEQSSQEHAEWFVSMFKKALDSYHQQQMQEKLEEAEKSIDKKYPEQTNEEKDVYFDYEASIRKEGAKWLLNHLKNKNQRNGRNYKQ